MANDYAKDTSTALRPIYYHRVGDVKDTDDTGDDNNADDDNFAADDIVTAVDNDVVDEESFGDATVANDQVASRLAIGFPVGDFL